MVAMIEIKLQSVVGIECLRFLLINARFFCLLPDFKSVFRDAVKKLWKPNRFITSKKFVE